MPRSEDQGDIILSANRTATTFLTSFRGLVSLTNALHRLHPETQQLVAQHCEPILTALRSFSHNSHDLAMAAEGVSRKIAESLEAGQELLWRAERGLEEARIVQRNMEALRKQMSSVGVAAGHASKSIATHAVEQNDLAGELSRQATNDRMDATAIRKVKWICVATVISSPIALGLNIMQRHKLEKASRTEADARLRVISSSQAESIGEGFTDLQQAFGTLVMHFSNLTQSLGAALNDRSWRRDKEEIFLERAALKWRECEVSNRRYRQALSTGMSVILPWKGVDCDGCGAVDLTGRFRCTVCKDYDLCSECVENVKEIHPEHAEQLQLYYSHQCDGCRRYVTSGEDWWRCKDCDDYDLCITCVESGNHAGNPKAGHRRSHKLEPVFSRHQCDNCEQFPIFGPRYDCTVCNDYCLCQHCKSLRFHDHRLIKRDTAERHSQE